METANTKNSILQMLQNLSSANKNVRKLTGLINDYFL